MISLFFPYLIKWTQKDIQTKDFFVFNNNGNIVAKWLLQLLRTIFSFQPIDASLSLSKKKMKISLRNKFPTFLNDLQFHLNFILCGHEML